MSNLRKVLVQLLGGQGGNSEVEASREPDRAVSTDARAFRKSEEK